MILQLRQLRKNMYRGYYVRDTYKRRGATVSQPLNFNKLQVVFENLEDSIDNMKEFVMFASHFSATIYYTFAYGEVHVWSACRERTDH